MIRLIYILLLIACGTLVVSSRAENEARPPEGDRDPVIRFPQWMEDGEVLLPEEETDAWKPKKYFRRSPLLGTSATEELYNIDRIIQRDFEAQDLEKHWIENYTKVADVAKPPVRVNMANVGGTVFLENILASENQKARRFDSIRFAERHLEDILNALTKPGDPPISVIFGNGFRSRKIETKVDLLRGGVIEIEPGALVDTKNLSELAALFATEIAKIKPEFEAKHVDMLRDLDVPKDVLASEYIRKRIEGMGKGGSEEILNEKRKLLDAYRLALQQEHYALRKENTDVKRLMSETGFKIDVDGVTELRVRQAVDAVDRLTGSPDGTGSEGGFDPWGIVGPKRSRSEIELLGANPKGRIRSALELIFGRASAQNTPQKRSTQAMELEFVEKYVLWLENREQGNFARLKHRGQPLDPSHDAIRANARFAQKFYFGPEMQDIALIGGIGVIALGGYIKGVDVLSSIGTGVSTTWDTGKMGAWNLWSYISSFFTSSNPGPAPVEQPRGPGFLDRIGQWISNVGEWFGGLWPKGEPSTSKWAWKDYLPPMPEWVGEMATWTGKTAYYPLGVIESQVLSPLAEFATRQGWPGVAAVGAVAAAYALERLVAAPIQTRSARFFHRYRINLQEQAHLFNRLRKVVNAGPPSVEDIADLAKHQNLATEFIEAGNGDKYEFLRNRLVYMVLFGKNAAWHQYASKKREYVSNLYNQLIEAVETELKNQTGKDRVPARKVKKLARQILAEDYIDRGSNTPVSGAQQLQGIEGHAQKTQKLLYFMFGALAQRAAETNTTLLLRLIDTKLSEPGLTSADKSALREQLLALSSLPHLRKQVQSKYIAIWRKHFPQDVLGTVHSARQLLELHNGKTVPEFVLRLRARELATEKLPPAELAEVLRALVAMRMHTDAARFLYKHLPEVAAYSHDAQVPPELRAATRKSIATLLAQWRSNYEEKLFPIKEAGKRNFFKIALLLRAAYLSDPKTRFAFGTHLREAVDTTTFSASDLALKWYSKRINRTELDPSKDAVEQIETLHREHDVESRFLAELFLSNLEKNPEILPNKTAVFRVLGSEQPWHNLKSVAQQSGAPWEAKLFQRYSDLSKKYPSYNYNPGHSEKVQRLLLRRFEQLAPTAELSERLLLWRMMAGRGPTGVTDAYMEKLVSEMTPAEASGISLKALENGWIWDPQIRSTLYKKYAEPRLGPQTLVEVDREQWKKTAQQLQSHKAELRSIESAEAKQEKLGEILATFDSMEFDVPSEKSRFRAEVEAQLLKPDEVDFGKVIEPFKKGGHFMDARNAVIQAELEKISGYFPESGYAAAHLFDWVSHRLQTRESEARGVKDRFVSRNTEEKDLGFSVVNEIIEEASGWDPVDKWKLIRWLRGAAGPPEIIVKKMRRMGPETVRRLYSTLPTLVRSTFISTLLGAPKTGLLENSGKNLYYEQVLNEIMPRGEKAANIANDLLESFLVAMERVSNPAKRRAVLSYLLAHPVEQSDTGTVLKNLLESYGVPGIKLGQTMAAGDFLPEHIRSKLADLHDRAKEPYRHEIFERLKETLKTEHIEPLFVVEDLRGSASMKYTVSVLDGEGKRHAIQIKREEAEAALLRNFEELRIVVDELIKKSPQLYSFLKGMVRATRDAIRRELSLVREGQKADLAKAEYLKLPLKDNVLVEVSQTTPLIEKVANDPAALYQLRSSEFSEGRSINAFPPSVQAQMAEFVLTAESEILFPQDGRSTHADPDRHPGNILWAVEDQGKELLYRFQPIDWGQQFQLTEADRNRVVELVAFSQIFENVGAEPALVDRLIAFVGIEPSQQAALRKALSGYFPNTSAKPRSMLGPYYFLLSALEGAGMRSNMLNYDLINGIFRLQAYESKTQNKNYRSPKKVFTDRVMKRVSQLVDATGPKMSRIRYALNNSNPTKWKVALRNQGLHAQGKLSVDKFLAEMGVSSATRDRALAGVKPERVEALSTAEGLTHWLGEVSTNPKLRASDRALIGRWLAHPRMESVQRNLPLLTAEDVRAVMNSSQVLSEISQAKEKTRSVIAQPEKHSFLRGVRDVYLAEFLNAVFWSLYERNPELAETWAQSLMTWSKHTGFVAFAATHSGVNHLVNRRVPVSHKASRYLLGNGLGVALSMAVSDVVHRLLQGESFADIWEQLITTDYARELGWNTLTFLSAEAASKTAFGMAGQFLPRQIACSYLYRTLAPLTSTFLGSEALNRTFGQQLREMGWLPSAVPLEIERLGKIHGERIERAMEKLTQTLGIKDKRLQQVHFMHALTGVSSVEESTQELADLSSSSGHLSFKGNDRLRMSLNNRAVRFGGLMGEVQAYEKALSEELLRETDPRLIELLKKELLHTRHQVLKTVEFYTHILSEEPIPREEAEKAFRSLQGGAK